MIVRHHQGCSGRWGFAPVKLGLYYAQAVSHFDGESKPRPTATNANRSAAKPIIEDNVNKKSKQAKISGEQTETAKAPNNELWNQLGHAVTMAAKEDQIVWTIFGVFWAANAVLLVGLFTTGEMPSAKVGVVISTIGIVLSCVWFIIQRRAISWLEYYEKIIFWIEESEYLKIPPDIALIQNQEAF